MSGVVDEKNLDEIFLYVVGKEEELDIGMLDLDVRLAGGGLVVRGVFVSWEGREVRRASFMSWEVVRAGGWRDLVDRVVEEVLCAAHAWIRNAKP